jgi:hypothetical protein
MSIQAGFTCPITNPLVTEISTALLAADISMGKMSSVCVGSRPIVKGKNKATEKLKTLPEC